VSAFTQILVQGNIAANDTGHNDVLNLPPDTLTKIFFNLKNWIFPGGKGGRCDFLVKSPSEALHGMFSSDGHAVDRFLERKRLEKEYEYGS